MSRHELYESWRAHKRRGMVGMSTLEEYEAGARARGWLPGAGHRLTLNHDKTELDVNRLQMELEPEYDLWARMIGRAGIENAPLDGEFSDFYAFQHWVKHCVGKHYVDLNKCRVARYDTNRGPYAPWNVFLAPRRDG